MAKLILPRPAVLISQLQTMIAALEKYTSIYTPVSPSQSELTSCLAELTAALNNQIQAAGAAEKATRDMYEARDKAVDLLRRSRDALYAFFGKSDPRLVEFGLDTMKSRKGRNSNGSDTQPSNNG